MLQKDEEHAGYKRPSTHNKTGYVKNKAMCSKKRWKPHHNRKKKESTYRQKRSGSHNDRDKNAKA
jgi:hypothetical protein